MSSAISIKNLTKYYRNFKAIENLSLEVKEGEFFGLLGPNGAGKTTTISVITGLANYKQGDVKIFGYDVTKEYRKTRALIGLVPQEFNFDPFLSAENILVFEAGYFGIEKKEAKKRAKRWLNFFQLWDKKDQGYKKFSGGMKRRLLIARALMHNPKILILDEPTAGVDLELRYQLWDFLKKINKDGTTIVLTTHYIEEAERLCDRIAVVHEGNIVAEDPVKELIRKMSGEEVLFHLSEPITSAPNELGDTPVYLEDGGQIIRFEEKEGAVSKVLNVFHEKGLEIKRIDVRKPTLEDAFLRLIQGSRTKEVSQ